MNHIDFMVETKHLNIPHDERADLRTLARRKPSRDNEYLHVSTLPARRLRPWIVISAGGCHELRCNGARNLRVVILFPTLTR